MTLEEDRRQPGVPWYLSRELNLPTIITVVVSAVIVLLTIICVIVFAWIRLDREITKLTFESSILLEKNLAQQREIEKQRSVIDFLLKGK